MVGTSRLAISILVSTCGTLLGNANWESGAGGEVRALAVGDGGKEVLVLDSGGTVRILRNEDADLFSLAEKANCNLTGHHAHAAAVVCPGGFGTCSGRAEDVKVLTAVGMPRPDVLAFQVRPPDGTACAAVNNASDPVLGSQILEPFGFGNALGFASSLSLVALSTDEKFIALSSRSALAGDQMARPQARRILYVSLDKKRAVLFRYDMASRERTASMQALLLLSPLAIKGDFVSPDTLLFGVLEVDSTGSSLLVVAGGLSNLTFVDAELGSLNATKIDEQFAKLEPLQEDHPPLLSKKGRQFLAASISPDYRNVVLAEKMFADSQVTVMTVLPLPAPPPTNPPTPGVTNATASPSASGTTNATNTPVVSSSPTGADATKTPSSSPTTASPSTGSPVAQPSTSRPTATDPPTLPPSTGRPSTVAPTESPVSTSAPAQGGGFASSILSIAAAALVFCVGLAFYRRRSAANRRTTLAEQRASFAPVEQQWGDFELVESQSSELSLLGIGDAGSLEDRFVNDHAQVASI